MPLVETGSRQRGSSARRVRRFAAASALCAACLASSGCGPIISSYLIVAAQADIDGAQAAEAEKYAVYEYTSAKEFIHKAREEQGFADFGPAIDYAYKAQDMALKARNKAEEEKRRAMEQPGATWEAPQDEGTQPSVIIKKKDAKSSDQSNEPVKVKVVPIPTETPK